MSDAQDQSPEKNQKSRSFGTFMLFLFVLFVVLAVVGKDRIHSRTLLTQDEYLWYLYTGRIDSQVIHGTPESNNSIEGFLIDPITKKEEAFKVNFADVERDERRFQQASAVRNAELVQPDALLDALEDGWYVPTEARSLTATKLREGAASRAEAAEPETAGAALVAAEPEVVVEERLLLEVRAKSDRAWERAAGAGTGRQAPFPLPDRSGHVWLDVDLRDYDDLGGLLASVESYGVTPEHLQFDLRPNKGTSREDSSSLFTTFLLYSGPLILVLIIFFVLMRQMRAQGGAGGVMSFGRSRAQLYTKDNHTNVTFDDVAGLKEAKSEVSELVEFLKNPGRFTRIGGRIPRGVLLVGPPGCGKTLLAKAIAGEAEVPFFSISGSDFVEMFVGVGASRVRDLFKQARDNSPCIIFLDEIDAVGRRRGSGMGGGHDEREQTLNAILVEMDGFGTDKGIIVIAATNRPDVLDPALLRPGRFDREVTIEYPDMEGRREIIDVHLRRVKAEPEVDIDTLARSTPGYSGADLAAIVNEAAIMAVLDKCDAIRMEHLEEARDKVRYGRQKRSQKVEEEDRRIIAYHESGHAIVGALVDEVDSPHKVTIIPRGRSLGSTMTVPTKENYIMQKKRLLGQLAVLFGGRVAEALFCGDIGAGASDDIRRATDLARAMVTELGMSDKVGPVNYAERQGSDFLGTELMRGKLHSERTARDIDEEVENILRAEYQRATDLLSSHRDALETMAQALLKHETITGEEVGKILAGTSLDDLRPEPEPEPEPDPAPRPSGERRTDPEAGGEVAGDLPGSPGLSPA